MNANLYLHFKGCCEEALNFYEKALGGVIEAMINHRDTPAAAQTAPEWLDKIIHERIRFGTDVVMASDAPEGRYIKPQGFTLSLRTDTAEEAERAFAALSEKGQVGMAMAETFFAYRFGMVTDRFEIPWMVLCEKKP